VADLRVLAMSRRHRVAVADCDLTGRPAR